MTQLNINTDAVVKFTNMLEKLHRSALPVAIREALNNAAFDVKMNTMPKTANKTFVERSPNFFKSQSKVEKAVGFDMNRMQATVGFIEGGLRGGNNYAVKDLEQQEHSGSIGGRSFIPLKQAREGNNNKALVRPNVRISKIKNIVRAGRMNGKNKGERFIKAAVKAGRGGYVLSASQILFKIDSLKKKTMKLRATPLYKFKKSGKPKVAATHFMEQSSLQSGNKIENYYIQQAEKQIARLTK